MSENRLIALCAFWAAFAISVIAATYRWRDVEAIRAGLQTCFIEGYGEVWKKQCDTETKP